MARQSATRTVAAVVTGAIVLASCSTGTDATSSSNPTETTQPTTTMMADTTTTTLAEFPATEAFRIPVGTEGLTYDRDGDPPSGPSSFVVLADGSVVVADTMAASRGEPRLLHFDRFGQQIAVIDLASAEVAAIVDVVRDGDGVAVLDVHVDRSIYRVIRLDLAGGVEASIDVPEGSRFADGLTGLGSDDIGLLLEFEFGARYQRIDTGTPPVDATPVFSGREIEVVSGTSRDATIRVGDESWTVSRDTDLGGVSLVGVGPDETIVVVVDEVDTTGSAFVVTRRVQRYTFFGELVSENRIDAGDQEVEIARPLEVGADGKTMYLFARPDHIEILPEPFEELPSGASA